MDEEESSDDERSVAETGVLLGYATKAPTDDPINQLGGIPSWLEEQPPSAALVKCRVCNDLMALLLQLNGDLPERFPEHERRLYIFSCRRRTCRRKGGSVRGLRACRVLKDQPSTGTAQELVSTAPLPEKSPQRQNLGESIFGVAPLGAATASANPFSTSSTPSVPPTFATSSLAAIPPQRPTADADALSATFASKARISSPPPVTPSPSPSTRTLTPPEPYPPQSSFPPAYPSYHLDAEYETLSHPSTPTVPPHTAMDIESTETSSSSTAGASAREDKEAFESSLDAAFQRFADRLAQNAEQVLRYEFGGAPLLYSKSDAVGRLLAGSGRGAGMPRCAECGGERVFEVQLTPHAITELEAEEEGLEGMEWGTILLGVCGADCVPGGRETGGVGYAEEWVGVQWEDMGKRS